MAFCKTTGGKGSAWRNLADPDENGAAEWNAANNFAHEVCIGMAAEAPSKYLMKFFKKSCEDRMYLDHIRNDYLANAVALFSPRVRPGVIVSMLISGSAVTPRFSPAAYSIRSAPILLKY